MVLTTEQREKLISRLADVRDYGGNERVAELAQVTTRVIQKAMTGGNVRVETMESITTALSTLETERKRKLAKVEKALSSGTV